MKEKKKERICRLCDGNLYAEPIYSLHNIPQAAQSFLKRDQLNSDSGIDISICQCAACGLVQLTSSPVKYYREVITSASVSDEMRAFRIRQIGEFADRFGLVGKKVIEIGCGEGYCLDILSEFGVCAFGLEASEKAGTIGRNKGRKILSGYIEKNTQIEGGPFDAFIMINFLEHAPRPRDLMSGININLVPDAVGMVEVPSLEHVIEAQRFYDFVPDHLSYFTEQTLHSALETSGFDVLSSRRVWNDYDIVAHVQKRDKLDFRDWDDNFDQLKKDLAGFVESFDRVDKEVAVWGASHQALTILAISGQRKIKYIIDSAPFKQGLYTPVTHMPIVSPLRLKDDKVDAVLVMAAGYSDEVVRILREELSYRGNIAVLRGNSIEIVQRGALI